jgi:hypothetical protein
MVRYVAIKTTSLVMTSYTKEISPSDGDREQWCKRNRGQIAKDFEGYLSMQNFEFNKIVKVYVKRLVIGIR